MFTDESLEATGYRYVSVVEANEVTTHLYFQKKYQGTDLRGRDSNPSPNADAELDLFEFPILFDDLSARPLKGGWEEPSAEEPEGSMLYRSVQLADKMSMFGGIVVVLSHPTDEWSATDERSAYLAIAKLKWQEGLFDRTQNAGRRRTGSVGSSYSTSATFSEMGDFVWGRNAVELDITTYDAQRTLHIQMDATMPIKGLTLEIPNLWNLVKFQSIAMEVRPSGTTEHKILVIEHLIEDANVIFDVS